MYRPDECSLCTPSLSSEHDAEKEVQNGWETTEKRLGGPKAAGEEVFTKLRRLGTAGIKAFSSMKMAFGMTVVQ